MKRALIIFFVVGILIASPFGGGKAEATGWGGCSWGIDYPFENADHDLTSQSVWFSCDTTGTRTLTAQLTKDNSLFPDLVVKTRSITFLDTWHGEFTITDVSCDNTRAAFSYFGTAKLTNPETGNSSSKHRSSNRLSTINC